MRLHLFPKFIHTILNTSTADEWKFFYNANLSRNPGLHKSVWLKWAANSLLEFKNTLGAATQPIFFDLVTFYNQIKKIAVTKKFNCFEFLVTLKQ